MQRVKVNDEVVILAGKDKGRQGKVVKVLKDKLKKVPARVLVEGVNMIKKHVKPDPNKSQQGGILEREATIHISNVALVNSATGKADKVGIKTLEDGRKVRFYKSNGELVDI
jgi:large subunit ribosomal protein L24